MIKLDSIESLNWNKSIHTPFYAIIILLLLVNCKNYKADNRTDKVFINQNTFRFKSPHETQEEYYNFIINSPKLADWKLDSPHELLHCSLYFHQIKAEIFFKEVFKDWINTDYNAATNFMENWAKNESLEDIAIEIIVKHLKDSELSTAVAWAHEINDSAKRHSLLEELATH